MIKLERAAKPSYLTDEKVEELTALFEINPNKQVWNHQKIKAPLLLSGNNKCAFCECLLTEESKYMEVEHFRCKKIYKHLVVEWTNLLPSCKRCNIAKKDHNVEEEYIVNPYDDEPKQHLGFTFRRYLLTGLTQIGVSTINCLNLNDYERLVYKRFEIGIQTGISIENAVERLNEWLNSPSTRSRNRLISMVETILQECQPESTYAAITATIVLSDKDFSSIIAIMNEKKIWENHLEIMLQKAKQIKLNIE